MNATDQLPAIKGRWHLAVYDGEVERLPLTPEQRRENRTFRRLHPGAPFPLYVGRVVSRPIDAFAGDNVVTTNGKGLLLDRLFAMAGTPTQVNGIGVGNSATAAAATDTQLLGATPAPYLQAFDALPTRSGLVVTSVTTVATANGNQNWQELGQFNGVTNGTSVLFNRIAPIGAFNKTSSVSIIVTVTTTQS
jgi:hypothetical protein